MFCYKNIRNKPSYFPEVCHYLVTTIWLCFVCRQKKSATKDPSKANEPGRPHCSNSVVAPPSISQPSLKKKTMFY